MKQHMTPGNTLVRLFAISVKKSQLHSAKIVFLAPVNDSYVKVIYIKCESTLMLSIT